LNQLLFYNPEKRISATQALQHAYWDESPPMKDPEWMPTWPSRTDGRKKRPANTAELLQQSPSADQDKNREIERETFVGMRDRQNYYHGAGSKPFLFK